MDELPELKARREFDGWWVTIRAGGQTRPPESMVGYLVQLGFSEPEAADHVAAAVLKETHANG
jgi:hypothetical protein